ncbi:MAG: Gfo/Idh/MocA family oxidoreductase [Planctomycetota bacterium]
MGEFTRRDFVRTTAVAGFAAAALPGLGAFAAGRDRLGVGVIGCGGRGSGAAINALEANESTEIVAMGDLFPDRLDHSFNGLSQHEFFGDRVKVGERRFSGFDAVDRVLAADGVDMVILATPPAFRPQHFDAAIRAGKHVFMEKPAAVCPAGCRLVIDAAARAEAANLSVVAGTQRRHEISYVEAMNRIADGAIGDIISARCFWNQGGLWVHERNPSYSDVEWQLRNWLYFCWTSGDHICEQHVHNIDIVNWAMGGPPREAYAMGGRQTRTAEKYGNVFDHFASELDYGDGRHALSFCRQQDGTEARVQEDITGTAGTASLRPRHATLTGATPWKFSGKYVNPYLQEHIDLIASIRGERTYLNEGKQVAESTLTAIMARMSAYSGKRVTWEQAMSSKLDLMKPSLEFGDLAIEPVPTPGETPLI